MPDMLMADSSIWPVLIFWVVFALIGRAAAANKKRAQQQQQGTADRASGAEVAAQGGLFAELKRAMEELKRAEAEQRGQAEQRTIAPPAPAFDREAQKRQAARQYLEKKKQEAARKRAARQERFASLPDASDMSSEDAVVPSHGRDYDDEADAIIKARRAAAERGRREESSPEELSEQQRARRGSRQDVAIGSRAEHDAWHQQIEAGAQPAEARARLAGPLRRFADGSLRSAVILGEILGGPVGGRQQDG